MPMIFQSEHVHSYTTYTFGYAVYAKRVAAEPISLLYESGFLPYSGNAERKQWYYMARSARINLATFALSSENRRVRKKFDPGSLITTVMPAHAYLDKPDMIEFCLEYFKQRHGPGVMDRERLIHVLSHSPETNVIRYADRGGATQAYIIEVDGDTMGHYWFSFYNLSLAFSSFGMWLMLDRTMQARQAGKRYYYVGTVYGSKALYKTNLPSLAFWDGAGWRSDVRALKALAYEDGARTVHHADRIKEQG